MTSLGLVLVLAAAVCHATWNYFVKKINGGPELIWLFSLITVVIYAPLAIWFAFASGFHAGPVEIGFIAGSALLHLGYFLLLQKGYRVGDLSLVYPIARATGPLLSTSFAVLFLNEAITGQTALGALTIILGILLLSGGLRRGSKTLLGSVAFGLAAGALIGSYTVWDAHTVSALAVPPLLMDYVSSLGRLVILAPVARRRTSDMRAHWRHHKAGLFAIAVFNPLAYILVLYALTFTPVVYVAPAREMSVLLTVLAGSLLLNEGNLRWRLSWACVSLAGVVLLATG